MAGENSLKPPRNVSDKNFSSLHKTNSAESAKSERRGESDYAQTEGSEVETLIYLQYTPVYDADILVGASDAGAKLT